MKTITFELAQKLKQVGYDIPTQNRFDKDGNLNKTGTPRYGEPSNWNNSCFNDGYRNYCSAPSYEEMFDWFLQTFKIFAYIKPYHNGGFTGIINYYNNVWFDGFNEDYYKMRDILYMETLLMIEKEFINEVLKIYSFHISPAQILLFSHKHDIKLFCYRPGDEKNFVNFHFQKMDEPQPESYMEIDIQIVGHNVFCYEPSVELYKLLNTKGFTFDKKLHISKNFKPTDLASVKINLNDKTYEFGPIIFNKDIETDLSTEDVQILIERLFKDERPTEY